MAALESQGWLIGKASEYDKVNAVYPEDLIGYFQSAYPDRWDKFCKNSPQNPEQVLIKATTRELDKRGTLELKSEFKQSVENARDARKRAENDGDKVGLNNAEKTLKDIGEGLDQLDLFKKNLTSFVRAYEFLSQIVSYEDRELEQLCVFAKHLSPLLRIDRLDDDEIDVSELALTHYRLTKRNEQQLKLSEESEEYALKPLSDVGSGKAHDPEKKRLSEIIETLNDLFGAEVNDKDQLHFAQGVADRISRDDNVMT
jgi:hypothetical protein